MGDPRWGKGSGGGGVVGWLRRDRAALVVLLLVIAPYVADYTPLYTALLTEAIVFGLFALAFDIALGHTGVLSLGHSAFFGVAAYTTGLLLVHRRWGVGESVAAGMLAGLLTALIMGGLALRKRGVYFAMLTLALSQIPFFVVRMTLNFTGGDDGLSGVPKLKLIFPFEVPLSKNPRNLYFFIAAVVGVCTLLIRRILRSPFGRAMRAVRENEERASACGYNTQRVKLLAILLSGLFSGVAGALLTVLLEFVPIENVHWSMSGTVVIMAMFGGSGTFLGPFVGSTVFLWMRDYLSKRLEFWEVFVGGTFILIVLFLPEGIVGTLKRWLLARRAPAPGPLPAPTAPGERRV